MQTIFSIYKSNIGQKWSDYVTVWLNFQNSNLKYSKNALFSFQFLFSSFFSNKFFVKQNEKNQIQVFIRKNRLSKINSFIPSWKD